MELGLKGKVALVTGGSKGIGHAVAFAFAEEGTKVAICARGAALLEQVSREIAAATGAEVFAFAADLSKPEGARELVQAAVARLNRVDILVNCAGAAPPGRLLQLTEEDWERAIGLKLMGYIRCAREVIPHMQRQGGGRIINISGGAAREPGPWMLTAGAVNAALLNFTKALADDVAKDNITVNAILPGRIATERLERIVAFQAREEGTTPEEAQRKFLASVPLGRIGQPEEIAYAVLFLASERARFITGTSLTVDGGKARGVV